MTGPYPHRAPWTDGQAETRITENGKGGSGEDHEERQPRLGAWISNQRSRAATLSPERAEQLSAIGMRWI
ncbi:helicase associated domain-containing protein [Streptomyces sp. NPDC046759]|uniref:helicase associated domain-containing protein n=1 Tax=Streptomyces sp. NPDC046759 TaxID=3155019 RepID=UPI0033EBB49A